LPIFVAVIGALAGFWLAGVAPDDRRVVVGTTALALLEVGIVIAIANLFSAFSSPFLTAMLTVGCVVVGRSADTLARLPARVFGRAIAEGAQFIARIVPNLMTYVPARPLLTGELPGIQLPTYLGQASFMALGWIIVLLTLSSLLFARRDFT
jgi:ABC-type transport system involved in multi-copper enzyme maturation permease subunit